MDAKSQITEAIATVDAQLANRPLNWDNRLGVTDPELQGLLARRHSLLLALDTL